MEDGEHRLGYYNLAIDLSNDLNIERGFDSLAEEQRTATLLLLMNRLDQRLEAILAGKVADTIKIVPNQSSIPPSTAPKPPEPELPPGSWYLQSTCSPTDIEIDPDGSVRAGTAAALVERLTTHEQEGSPMSTIVFIRIDVSQTQRSSMRS